MLLCKCISFICLIRKCLLFTGMPFLPPHYWKWDNYLPRENSRESSKPHGIYNIRDTKTHASFDSCSPKETKSSGECSVKPKLGSSGENTLWSTSCLCCCVWSTVSEEWSDTLIRHCYALHSFIANITIFGHLLVK